MSMLVPNIKTVFLSPCVPMSLCHLILYFRDARHTATVPLEHIFTVKITTFWLT